MKICAVVAEYNPLHLGHVKQLSYIKESLGAENVIVIMSGNFTQRGEPAVLDKYTRARHAILSGADLVLELPTVFATANAEIFAKGAISVLNDLGCIDGLCFGVESGTREDYISLAVALNNESKEFKKILKEKLETGVSLAKAKFETLKELGEEHDPSLIGSPNNILGVEYTKAIAHYHSNIEIYPLIREGNHNEEKYKKGLTSAKSIRNLLKDGKIKKAKSSMPTCVFKDLKEYPFAFDKLLMLKLLTTSLEELKEVLDCTEGLENRIKALSKDNKSLNALIEKAVTKRYTEPRIRRIITSNLLGIKKELAFKALESELYAKVLAVNAEKKDLISVIAKSSSIPLITRKSQVGELKKHAKACFDIDVLANDIYNLATNKNQNEFLTLFV